MLIEKAKTRASLLTKLSILTVSNDFVIYNKNLLDNIVDNLSNDTSVVYAIIVDSSDNRILTHSDHDWDGKIIDNGLTSSFKESGIYEFSGDINISGKKYGALKIEFSLKNVYQEIAQMKQRFLFVALTAVVLGAVFSIISARIISTPIKALVAQTKIIGTGNLENKIVYKSKDILGQLANEFNKMVSALKAKQQQVIDSEARLQRLVENMPVMMDALDKDYKIIAWNRECERVTGYSAKEMIGNPHSLEMLYPDDGYREKMISEFVDLEYDLRNKEYALNRKDGTEKTISWSNISGRCSIPGWYTWAIGVDVTNRVQAEKTLRESEEKLARSKKMESLGLLAGGVAHDLNNVLSGIVSYPELLLTDLPEDSKLRKPIETMQESGHRAAAIVQDLLTVARGVATIKVPLNLNALVRDYFNSPEFKKLKQFHPTVAVKTNLDTDLLNIGGSHVHIRKVVMNLVSNASEAIERSGQVTISTVNRYVDSPLKGYDDVNIGEYVVLAVSDNGSGISSDDLERIFEPFYTKKVMGRSGTGLGLAVVWNTVQDHHGYVDVKSDENGTTFELYFPITRDEIADKDLSIPIKDYKGDGETILVVDDVESQRDISCKMLDKLGYKTKAVSSGEEAVEYIKENTVDLLLLDMIMDPGINGRETYERIIKIHPNQKAIIASGFAETDDVRAAQKMGAGRYIKKPLTLEKIGLAVIEELEK
jgi:PAS domain S-box-containing protein